MDKSLIHFDIDLRVLMIERNLDEQQLAAILGLHYWTVRDWLNGISVPTDFYLKLICDKLKVSIGKFSDI